MNLRFSIPPEVLRQRGIEISQLVMGVLPGSAAHIDEGKGILYVTLPQGVHPALATDTVVRALAGIGITAYFMADTPNYAPPIQMGEKKRRGVPLPVFIVSLIAVALAACILTVSDNLITKEQTTSEERQNSFKKMMILALESIL